MALRDVTITMVDDSFHLAGSLSAGSHTFRVINGGRQAHMMQMVRLEPGKTLADVVAWDPASKTLLPIEWSGGMAYMAPAVLAISPHASSQERTA